MSITDTALALRGGASVSHNHHHVSAHGACTWPCDMGVAVSALFVSARNGKEPNP